MDLDSDLAALVAPLRHDPAAGAVLLDLDGTLAPIVERPSDVRMLPGMAEALVALRARFGLLGFVSGRRLDELERIVGLDGCAYAGNHGMEIHRRGAPARLAGDVAPHAAGLAELVRRFPAQRLAPFGNWLEDKVATLTFHYRTAPDPALARAMLDREVVPAAAELGLVTAPGRMSLEVRPPVALDKGTAVRELLDGTAVHRAISVGDDRTDAHAWAAVHALRDEGTLDTAVAVAVRSREVPDEVLAAADAAVDGPEGVLTLLRHLADHADVPAARRRTSSGNG
jgi:trehalose 6-phosphate phosphatase